MFKYLIVTLMVFPGLVFSQEGNQLEPKKQDIYTDAQFLKKVAPRYPQLALEQGLEGWVVLSYVIDKSGSVKNPIVEDSSGYPMFERAALKAAKRVKFKPATLNGMPVEQSMESYRYTFAMEDSVGARSKFANQYKKIDKLLQENNLEESGVLIAELQNQKKRNLYEEARLWWLKAIYALKINDESGCLVSLRKVIALKDFGVENKLYITALHYTFMLEVKSMQFKRALSTFDQLNTSKEVDVKLISELQPIVEEIKGQVDGDKTFSVPGLIDDKEVWHHDLARRSFSYSDISGELNNFEIRCKHKYVAFDMSTTETWSIPESWGDECALYVFGEPGSSFNLYEYPLTGNPIVQ